MPNHNPQPRSLHSRWAAGFALLSVSIVLFGCTAFKLAQPAEPPLGTKSAAEQERDAVREADRLGQKPTPTNYSRN